MIRLLIADDHPILLEGFAALFDNMPDMQVVATAQNGMVVLEKLAHTPIDIAILDINMPQLNGVETCKKIKQLYPNVRVIALSMFRQKSFIKRMMKFGAHGYLLKSDPVEIIRECIEKVMLNERYLSSELHVFLSDFNFLDEPQKETNKKISSRELEVLKLISQGFKDHEIADELFISYHTANSHRKNLLQKFDAKNTAELVRLTIEKGII